MTPFATAEDFANRFGVALTGPEMTRADVLLDLASGVIRDEAGQDINRAADDVYTRPGTTDARILLPQRPVVSVSSVTLDGLPIDDWYLAGDAIVRKTGITTILTDGDILGHPYHRGFGYESQTLAITYTHGYADDAIPDWLKALALEMVVRVWVNPGSVIQASIAGTQTTYAPYSDPPPGLELTDKERRRVKRRFGSHAGGVWTGF